MSSASKLVIFYNPILPQAVKSWALARKITHQKVMKPQLPSDPEESILTPAEVARRYKVTSRTVLNWVKRGVLPAIRLGKVIRFRLSDVIKVVEK
jgi:excisionase family DNA binding protein